jgi:uncharacterized protein YndB with AHSA1/START domain
MNVPDQIQKRVTLRAPISRVWRAISNAQEFGAWFGMEFDGSFVAGQRITGRITPTTVDPDVARLQEPHAGKAFEMTIASIEPKRLFSFRWHPFAVDETQDYESEPTTLVQFELREVPEGTQLTITESGFSSLPLKRRAEAFAANDGGWEHQARLIAMYVQANAK